MPTTFSFHDYICVLLELTFLFFFPNLYNGKSQLYEFPYILINPQSAKIKFYNGPTS